MITSRRAFITGLGAALVTAPAIVRAGSLMPVKQMVEPIYLGIDLATRESVTKWLVYDGYVFWATGEDQIVRYFPRRDVLQVPT